MSDKPNTKRKAPERRPAGIKAMPAPPTRKLPDDHPARTMFKQTRDEETPTTTTATTPTTGTTPTTPIAPARDFQRVPNSITRQAVPAGMFTGKGKQVYDYLYSVTRGAVVPSRSVRIPMEELAVRSGVGSDRTLRKHLRRLSDVGLVSVNEIGGTQGGNEFLVFIPEELTPTTGTTTPTTHPYHDYHHSQNVPVVPVVESGSGTGGLTADYQRASDDSKTSFKTNTEKLDDERVPRPLASTERELTGKNAPADKWAEVWEVLSTELRIAAGRTTVSSVPAFLAEHLRRRLFKKDKRQLEQESASEGQSEPVAAVIGDISECPSCFGAGYHYPEGFEKGVARCKHEALSGEPRG